MKKNFQKLAGLFGMIGLLRFQVSVANADSMDGVNANAVVEKNVSAMDSDAGSSMNGRVLLTLNDLRTLLGLNNLRDPSDIQSKERLNQEDSNASQVHFYVKLSSSERAKLTRKLAIIQRERNALVQNLNANTHSKKAELRKKRKSIQVSRLSTKTSDEDVKLGMSLYETFIMESNTDAERSQKLADFDKKHLVTLDYIQVAGNKKVNNIFIGEAQIWSNDHRSVAQR
jgi:hypothetical protein